MFLLAMVLAWFQSAPLTDVRGDEEVPTAL